MDKDGPLDGRKRMKIIKTAKRGKSHPKKYLNCNLNCSYNDTNEPHNTNINS